MLNFRAFGHRITALEGRSLLKKALSDIETDIVIRKSTAPISKGYWGSHDANSLLEFTQHYTPSQPILTYGMVRIAVEELLQYFPHSDPNDHQKHYWETHFDVNKNVEGGELLLGKGSWRKINTVESKL